MIGTGVVLAILGVLVVLRGVLGWVAVQQVRGSVLQEVAQHAYTRHQLHDLVSAKLVVMCTDVEVVLSELYAERLVKSVWTDAEVVCGGIDGVVRRRTIRQMVVVLTEEGRKAAGV